MRRNRTAMGFSDDDRALRAEITGVSDLAAGDPKKVLAQQRALVKRPKTSWLLGGDRIRSECATRLREQDIRIGDVVRCQWKEAEGPFVFTRMNLDGLGLRVVSDPSQQVQLQLTARAAESLSRLYRPAAGFQHLAVLVWALDLSTAERKSLARMVDDSLSASQRYRCEHGIFYRIEPAQRLIEQIAEQRAAAEHVPEVTIEKPSRQRFCQRCGQSAVLGEDVPPGRCQEHLHTYGILPLKRHCLFCGNQYQARGPTSTKCGDCAV